MRSSSRPSSSATTAKVLSPRSMPTGDGALPVVRHRSRCRGKAWTFRLTRQRPPSRVLTVANRIFALSFLSIRRNRRVHSRTRRLPSFGKRTTRACSPSPTRIAAAFPAPLFRSRNACRAVALRLNLGNLGFFPARFPLRPLEKASSARPRSTAASSNTCWHTSVRQTSPGPASPASFERFQALNALMRSKPDHGTLFLAALVSSEALRSGCRFAPSALVTKRRHWLKAKRAAPTCRLSACSCSRLGSSVKQKVVCRLMLATQTTHSGTHLAERSHDKNSASCRSAWQFGETASGGRTSARSRPVADKPLRQSFAAPRDSPAKESPPRTLAPRGVRRTHYY